ncbi:MULTISPECIES: DUF962 domain-containing protein [unclassified Acinetobacter]|uniref:Mpo1 family 2-hydroxy fatty acid dioxygenase n=1 Tax=unclassified Acinetobacter TaxID=196816 RepID=UPI0035B7F112
MTQRSLNDWLADYAVSHQNHTNKSIHWLCVPVIFITIMGLIFGLSPYALYAVIALVAIFYLRLSISLGIAMLIFMLMILAFLTFVAVPWTVWLAIFVIAWIGQFVGHKIEGKKPSFFQDLQFLLIGPAWVACSILGKVPTSTSNNKT